MWRMTPLVALGISFNRLFAMTKSQHEYEKIDYANSISLFQEFAPQIEILSKTEETDSIDYLIDELKTTSERLGSIELNSNKERRSILRAILNMLEPNILEARHIDTLNNLLQTELQKKIVTTYQDIPTRTNINGTSISLFQGDITTIKIDAIVNAANSQLLGCFQPLHNCIDNAIHSNAGVQLRDDCFTIMELQKSLEPTGMAKITRAYNLPSKFVIHTVGPIVQGLVTPSHEADLANSYINCLETCKEVASIQSIAFCCISTGVFGYPPEQAATVAYRVVSDWLIKNPNQLNKVVFNVFSKSDLEIYKSIIPTT